MSNVGTPKTLVQAIRNGTERNDVHAHVRDYLAQRFSAAFLTRPESSEAIQSLWDSIFNNEGRCQFCLRVVVKDEGDYCAECAVEYAKYRIGGEGSAA
jgi:hypothetical protein